MFNTSNSCGFWVQKFPTQDNGFTAVVNASVSIGNGTFSSFGIADHNTASSDDPQVILQKAKQNAIACIREDAQSFGDFELSSTFTSPVQGSATQKQCKDPKKLGGGSKPASEKQKQIIADACKKRSLDPNKVCLNKCNRSFDELTGLDAHEIMQKLFNR